MFPTLERIAAAATTPTYSTLATARAFDPALTEEEYVLGRVVASEDGKGTPTSMCCIADATIGNAGGRELVAHVTAGQGFGEQGKAGRPVSTRLHPGPRHLAAAIAVLRRPFFMLPPPMRGVARGATRFISPRSQASSSSSSTESHCGPLVILERWTYAKPWANRGACELGPAGPKSQQLEWVGPIAGVDPWVQMFFRPATLHQGALYADARKVIESNGAYKGSPLLAPGDALVMLALFGVALALTEVA